VVRATPSWTSAPLVGDPYLEKNIKALSPSSRFRRRHLLAFMSMTSKGKEPLDFIIVLTHTITVSINYSLWICWRSC